jgi:hypothetical protein
MAIADSIATPAHLEEGRRFGRRAKQGSLVQRTAAIHVGTPSQAIRKTGVLIGFVTLMFFFVWFASLLSAATYFENPSDFQQSALVNIVLAGGLLLVVVGCLFSLLSIVGGAMASVAVQRSPRISR